MLTDKGSSRFACPNSAMAFHIAQSEPGKRTVPLVTWRVTRIELNGSEKFSLGPIPIPVIPRLHFSQCGVGFCELVIDFQSLNRGCPRFWISLLWPGSRA